MSDGQEVQVVPEVQEGEILTEEEERAERQKHEPVELSPKASETLQIMHHLFKNIF